MKPPPQFPEMPIHECTDCRKLAYYVTRDGRCEQCAGKRDKEQASQQRSIFEMLDSGGGLW
jgi:hypothetical protein